MQLLAVTPEPTEVDGTYGGLLEWDVFENPMRTGLLAEPLEVRDGLVAIPAGQGRASRSTSQPSAPSTGLRSGDGLLACTTGMVRRMLSRASRRALASSPSRSAAMISRWSW